MVIPLSLMTTPSGPVVERSPGVREIMGSIPGWVIPKTLKMVLGASLLSTRHSGIQRLGQGNMVGLPVVDCKM